MRLIVLLTLVTSLAQATEVTLGMKGITVDEYNSVTDTISLIKYKLKAKKYYHYIDDVYQPINRSIISEEYSRRSNYYTSGTLSFIDGSEINFEKGYFFKGIFKMIRVNGELNGIPFGAPAMEYNKEQHVIYSNRIMIKGEGIVLKSKFEYRLPLGVL